MQFKQTFRIEQLARKLKRSRGARAALHDWKRFVPETILICALLVGIDALFFGGYRFVGMTVSPLWIPVLLAASQYGLLGGAFAAIAATVALYAGAMPPHAAHQDFYDYASMLAVLPASWFGVAIVLGGLRTLHIHKEAQVRRQLTEVEERLSTCVVGLSRATTEIENLERRIATDTGTINRLLRGIATVDPVTREGLTNSIGPLVSDALSASTYTFYLRTSSGLEPIFSVDEEGAAVGEAAPLPGATVEALAAHPQTVVRSDANAAQFLPPGALMLAPIVGPSGALRGALVIDRVRAPQHAHATIAQRANHLGGVLGALMDAGELRMAAANETRTPAAGEA